MLFAGAYNYVQFSARKIYELRQLSRYILNMYLWWSLYTLYLLACQVRVTVGDSSLCYSVCVMSFERQLTMCVD